MTKKERVLKAIRQGKKLKTRKIYLWDLATGKDKIKDNEVITG